MERLKRILEKIDGLGYKAHKEIKGKDHFEGFILFIVKPYGAFIFSKSKGR